MGLLAILFPRWRSAFGESWIKSFEISTSGFSLFHLLLFQDLRRAFLEMNGNVPRWIQLGTVCIDSCKVAVSVSSFDAIHQGRNDGGQVCVMRLGLTMSMVILKHECLGDALLSYLFKASISTYCA